MYYRPELRLDILSAKRGGFKIHDHQELRLGLPPQEGWIIIPKNLIIFMIFTILQNIEFWGLVDSLKPNDKYDTLIFI